MSGARRTGTRVRGFAHKSGSLHEGKMAFDEEHAVRVITAQNWLTSLEKREAMGAARKAGIRAKITLPKLKFMDH